MPVEKVNRSNSKTSNKNSRKSRKRRSQERAMAWFTVIVAAILIIGLIVFVAIKLKNPARELGRSLYDKFGPKDITELSENKTHRDETVSDNTEAASVSQDETAISEADISAIFGEEETEEEDLEEVAVSSNRADVYEQQAQEIIDGMSTKQLVYQLFFVTPEALTGVDVATAAGEKTKQAFIEQPVGGIYFSAQNIESEDQIIQMTDNLQKYSKENAGVPIFLAIDEKEIDANRDADSDSDESENSEDESGDEQVNAESGEATEANNNAEEADMQTENYCEKAKTAFGYGFNLLLGESGINSDDYYEMFDGGIYASFGHYPGKNSDAEILAEQDFEELKGGDFANVQRLISAGERFLRVSNVSMPKLTGDEVPASMSGILISQKLLLDIGYNGIVITDDLASDELKAKYEVKTSVVEALKAGSDVIMLSENPEEAANAVLAAIEGGTLTEVRIKEAALKIIEAKLEIADRRALKTKEE